MGILIHDRRRDFRLTDDEKVIGHHRFLNIHFPKQSEITCTFEDVAKDQHTILLEQYDFKRLVVFIKAYTIFIIGCNEEGLYFIGRHYEEAEGKYQEFTFQFRWDDVGISLDEVKGKEYLSLMRYYFYSTQVENTYRLTGRFRRRVFLLMETFKHNLFKTYPIGRNGSIIIDNENRIHLYVNGEFKGNFKSLSLVGVPTWTSFQIDF